MDREIVNKAAEEYNQKLGKSRNVTWNDSEYGFIAGADWLMQQPLQERLTEEEKERIKEIYWQAAKDWIGIGDARGHCRTCFAIESIFGPDLFRDK